MRVHDRQGEDHRVVRLCRHLAKSARESSHQGGSHGRAEACARGSTRCIRSGIWWNGCVGTSSISVGWQRGTTRPRSPSCRSSSSRPVTYGSSKCRQSLGFGFSFVHHGLRVSRLSSLSPTPSATLQAQMGDGVAMQTRSSDT